MRRAAAMRAGAVSTVAGLVTALAVAVAPGATAVAAGPGAADPDFTAPAVPLVAGPGQNEAFRGLTPLADGSAAVAVVPQGQSSRVVVIGPSGAVLPDSVVDLAGIANGGQQAVALDLAVDADGALVFAGSVGDEFLVGRVFDGALDPTFAGVGYVRLPAPAGQAAAGFGQVEVEPDGTIVAVGSSYLVADPARRPLAVARLTPGGATDGVSVVGPTTAVVGVRDLAVATAPGAGARSVAVGEVTRGAQHTSFVLSFDAGGAPVFTELDLDADAGSADTLVGVAPAAGSAAAAPVMVVGLAAGVPVAGRVVVDELFGTAAVQPFSGTVVAGGLRSLGASFTEVFAVDRDDRGSFQVLGRRALGSGDLRLIRVDADGLLESLPGSGFAWTADQAPTYGFATFADTRPQVAVGAGARVWLAGTDVAASPGRVVPFVAVRLGRTAALSARIVAGPAVGAGQAQTVRVTIANAAGQDTARALLRLTLPPRATVASVPPGCAVIGPITVQCSLASVPSGGSVTLAVALRRGTDTAQQVAAHVYPDYYDGSEVTDDGALVRLRGQSYALTRPGSSCGATRARACVVPRGSRPYRLAATAALPVPVAARASTLRVERRTTTGRWVRVARPAVRVALDARGRASIGIPRALRTTSRTYRVRVVVRATSVSAAGVSPWRYLRVR